MRTEADRVGDSANALVLACVRLLRRLRALDPAPALGRAEATALAVLVEGGAMRIGDLARHEGVRAPTMTRIVQAMEARALVRRSSDRADGRSFLIQATAAGRRIFEAGQRRRLAPLEAMIRALEPGQRRALEAALPVLARLAASSVPDSA